MKHLTFVTLLALFSAPAMAYVGPGLGMGVIGTIFGVVAAIVLAVFGLLWYPLKRRFGKKKTDAGAHQTSHGSDATVQIGQPSSADTATQNHATSQPAALNVTSESTTDNRTKSPVQ